VLLLTSNFADSFATDWGLLVDGHFLTHTRAHASQVRLLGGIPLLLSLINRDNGAVLSSVAVGVCTVLTYLSFDDENAFEIRNKNGYRPCRALFFHLIF